MDRRLFRVAKPRAQTAGRRGALVGMWPEKVRPAGISVCSRCSSLPCCRAIGHHPDANRIGIIWKSVDVSIDRANRRRREAGLPQWSADSVPPVLGLDIDIEHESDRVVVLAANGVRHAGQELLSPSLRLSATLEHWISIGRLAGDMSIPWRKSNAAMVCRSSFPSTRRDGRRVEAVISVDRCHS